MEELAQILNQNGIDTTSLELIYGVEAEKLFCLTLPGAEPIDKWHMLRNLVEVTGFWPVLVEGKESIIEIIDSTDDWLNQYDAENLKELMRLNPLRPVSEIIEVSFSIDAAQWLEEQFKFQGDVPDPHFEYPYGEWPTNIPGKSDFYGPSSLDPVSFALVSTKNNWEIPAFLRYGNMNECPAPEIHTSLFKRWHALYGAEIVYLDYDTIEVDVKNPPETREQALKLAKEQYAYDPDIVEQGTGTINKLAAQLLNGTTWHFWWD